MTLTKKIVLSVLVLATLVVAALFLVSRISDSYALAAASIPASVRVTESVGAVHYSLLLGSSHKLQSAGGPSCGSFTFFVKGSKGIDLVEVVVTKPGLHAKWTVKEFAVGTGTRSSGSC